MIIVHIVKKIQLHIFHDKVTKNFMRINSLTFLFCIESNISKLSFVLDIYLTKLVLNSSILNLKKSLFLKIFLFANRLNG